ncbi:MAG: hypothetical protein Q7S88_01205 [Candidatus Daviesbacteria bacterium]|nr:hypothetical protein [Candidatus Daviesbacteria bacterium]
MIIIAILVVGAVAFFGGMKYQGTKATGINNIRGQFQRGMGGPNGLGGMGRMNGGAVIGEIISTDDNSITVKLEDGSSKIVLLSDSVTVSKTDTGSMADLKNGVKVGVFGTTNSDGTVTAQNVQLNPMFRMGQGAQASPSGSPE